MMRPCCSVSLQVGFRPRLCHSHSDVQWSTTSNAHAPYDDQLIALTHTVDISSGTDRQAALSPPRQGILHLQGQTAQTPPPQAHRRQTTQPGCDRPAPLTARRSPASALRSSRRRVGRAWTPLCATPWNSARHTSAAWAPPSKRSAPACGILQHLVDTEARLPGAFGPSISVETARNPATKLWAMHKLRSRLQQTC